MYILVAGGGKVGANLVRLLLRAGHEVTLIEQRGDRFAALEEEFEHVVHRGDATELFVLERAGITRPPDLMLALTGDDEDNVVICQLARERYGVPKVIARVNDPRNQAHFDLLGIAPTICATSNIMGLIEHEVPEHELVHLLELRNENLEIVEVQIAEGSPVAGKRDRQAFGDLHLHDLEILVAQLEQVDELVLGHFVLDQAHDVRRRADRRRDAEQVEVRLVARIVDARDHLRDGVTLLRELADHEVVLVVAGHREDEIGRALDPGALEDEELRRVAAVDDVLELLLQCG